MYAYIYSMIINILNKFLNQIGILICIRDGNEVFYTLLLCI